MTLRKLAKDLNSGKHGCPTVYADERTLTSTVDGLVVQGDVVDAAAYSAPPISEPLISETAQCEWLEDGFVVVQGPALTTERQAELENVLPGEAAVPVSASILFSQRGHLSEPGPGDIRVRIMADTVRRAMIAYQGASS